MEIKDLKRGTRVQLPFEEEGEVVDTISRVWASKVFVKITKANPQFNKEGDVIDFLENQILAILPNLTREQKMQRQVQKQMEEQVKEYPFCISWFHKSAVSPAGDKSKMQFFKLEDKQKATDTWFRLSERMRNKESYQQGYICYLTKNF